MERKDFISHVVDKFKYYSVNIKEQEDKQGRFQLLEVSSEETKSCVFICENEKEQLEVWFGSGEDYFEDYYTSYSKVEELDKKIKEHLDTVISMNDFTWLE